MWTFSWYMHNSQFANSQDRADFRIEGWLDQIMGVIWLPHDTDAKVLYPCHVHKSEHAENQDCADFRIWWCLDQIMAVIPLPHDTDAKVIYHYHV